MTSEIPYQAIPAAGYFTDAMSAFRQLVGRAFSYVAGLVAGLTLLSILQVGVLIISDRLGIYALHTLIGFNAILAAATIWCLSGGRFATISKLHTWFRGLSGTWVTERVTGATASNSTENLIPGCDDVLMMIVRRRGVEQAKTKTVAASQSQQD